MHACLWEKIQSSHSLYSVDSSCPGHIVCDDELHFLLLMTIMQQLFIFFNYFPFSINFLLYSFGHLIAGVR